MFERLPAVRCYFDRPPKVCIAKCRKRSKPPANHPLAGFRQVLLPQFSFRSIFGILRGPQIIVSERPESHIPGLWQLAFVSSRKVCFASMNGAPSLPERPLGQLFAYEPCSVNAEQAFICPKDSFGICPKPPYINNLLHLREVLR